MYILDIDNVGRNEDGFHGSGWYWFDPHFRMMGPYNSEYLACEAYAWKVHEMITQQTKAQLQQSEPRIKLL